MRVRLGSNMYSKTLISPNGKGLKYLSLMNYNDFNEFTMFERK